MLEICVDCKGVPAPAPPALGMPCCPHAAASDSTITRHFCLHYTLVLINLAMAAVPEPTRLALVTSIFERDVGKFTALLSSLTPNGVRAVSAATARPLPLLHALAAAGFHQGVPLALAAGVPISAADAVLRLHGRRQGGGKPVYSLVELLLPFLSKAQNQVLMDPLGACCLSLAATLGHAETLAAFLAAGANPNPAEPRGRPMWHPLSAAALSCCSNSRCHLGPPAASKSVAAAMVKLLLGAGADPAASIAAAPWATGWGAHSWLLHLGSRCRQLAMLELLLERSRQGGLPLRFDRASMLVLLSCQAD